MIISHRKHPRRKHFVGTPSLPALATFARQFTFPSSSQQTNTLQPRKRQRDPISASSKTFASSKAFRPANPPPPKRRRQQQQPSLLKKPPNRMSPSIIMMLASQDVRRILQDSSAELQFAHLLRVSSNSSRPEGFIPGSDRVRDETTRSGN